ncbi:hypothetical protein [Ramlibacter alkalitolerans]|uniref:Uncharacterized protein n=1 Tax=Ramlibacter alkalitolerans TaxID=2039631 RepID=A0ABS1JSI3_9BURK|nr:hypothetical protein [Ramlibacter alkalitolerans]MBL0427131.1 hypothetical protein [Ramlibacter alkalitolerans]
MTRPYDPASPIASRHFPAQGALLRLLAGTALAAVAATTLLTTDMAHAAQPLLKFDGGIGSQPLAAGAVPNAVFDVNPGGRPWVIERLTATIDINSNIKVDGRGLLLGGGNAVGRTGGQSVRPLLLCNDGTTVTSRHTTPAKALEADGDFSFNEPLTPQVPPSCGNPILLIVNTGGAWFAAGIPKN